MISQKFLLEDIQNKLDETEFNSFLTNNSAKPKVLFELKEAIHKANSGTNFLSVLRTWKNDSHLYKVW